MSGLFLLLLWLATPLLGQYDLKTIEPQVLEIREKALFQYWEFPDESLWWENVLDIPVEIRNYRDSLGMILGTRGLREQIEQLTKSVGKDHMNPDTISDGDFKNRLIVLTGEAGHIRAMNHLEAQILGYQMNRYPLLSHPTEFHAFLLRNQETGKVKVYFAAADTPWPPKPGIIIELMEKDLAMGWKLSGHLHNHYEPAEDQYLGILAPSLADAHYFKMLRDEFALEKALITNGFHTVEIHAEDLNIFESH